MSEAHASRTQRTTNTSGTFMHASAGAVGPGPAAGLTLSSDATKPMLIPSTTAESTPRAPMLHGGVWTGSGAVAAAVRFISSGVKKTKFENNFDIAKEKINGLCNGRIALHSTFQPPSQ